MKDRRLQGMVSSYDFGEFDLDRERDLDRDRDLRGGELDLERLLDLE